MAGRLLLALVVLPLAACSNQAPAPRTEASPISETKPSLRRPPPTRPTTRPPTRPAKIITFTGVDDVPDGAWCWFQDERAIVDPEAPAGPLLLITSTSSQGDNDLVHYNLETGALGRQRLHGGFEPDDHNTGALLQLADGRYLTAYAAHRRAPRFYWRTSVRPHDPSRWTDQSTLELTNATVTYSNLHVLRDEEGTERVFNFTRARDRDPNVLELSTPATGGWDWKGWLVHDPARRPYLRYASDGRVVHFLVTDGHPQTSDNSVFHGVFDGSTVRDGRGLIVREDLDEAGPTLPSTLTPVFEGSPAEVPWVVDLEVDPDGRPYALLSSRRDAQLHYHYARFDGERWRVGPLAHAGTALYEQQPDYSGLAALDPEDPSRVVISTNAEPATGAPLISDADGQRHWEIFAGHSRDDGITWTWSPLTHDSTVDNLRPVIPAWASDRRVLLWMRGTYRTYQDWDTQIVGMIQDRADFE